MLEVSGDSSGQDLREHRHFRNQPQSLSRENRHPYSAYRERTWKSRAETNANSSALRNVPHLSQLRSPGWRHEMGTGCRKTFALLLEVKSLHALLETGLGYSEASKTKWSRWVVAASSTVRKGKEEMYSLLFRQVSSWAALESGLSSQSLGTPTASFATTVTANTTAHSSHCGYGINPFLKTRSALPS